MERSAAMSAADAAAPNQIVLPMVSERVGGVSNREPPGRIRRARGEAASAPVVLLSPGAAGPSERRSAPAWGWGSGGGGSGALPRGGAPAGGLRAAPPAPAGRGHGR